MATQLGQQEVNGQTRPSIPNNPRTALLFGTIVILVSFLGFGSWAAVAPLAGAVIAPGVVKVDSNRKKIQHQEGGTVKRVAVRDGDRVSAGDVLLQLDETRAQATWSILQSRYYTARAAEARLLAERDGRDVIIWPDDPEAADPTTQLAEIRAGQQSLFEARRHATIGEVEILNNRIDQLGDDIKGIKAQQRAKERQISLIREEAASLKSLLDKGHTDRPRYLALQREIARLEGERGEHISAIAAANARIGETRLQIIQLQRDFREKVITELREVAEDLIDLQERLGAARHTLDHIDIRAPVSGIIVGSTAHTVGGVIAAGATIMEIVPVDDRLVVDARVQPQDIDNLWVGQSADINFTGLKQRTAPSIVGEVNYISADRLTDNRTGETYYSTHIVVAESELDRLGAQNLQPGMPADVMIRTSERTALQYFLQPLIDSFNHAWREE